MSNEHIKPTRYFGQGQPPLDQDIYENYFVDKRDGFFIECGASDGVGFNNTLFFEKNLDWNGILLEASSKQFRALEINRPKTRNLKMGLSDTTGVKIFKDVVSAPGGGEGNGSFTHTEEHLKELEGYRVVFEDYPVVTVTYTDLIETFGVTHVDLFSLDVEGHELYVIDGMYECDVLPDVFVIEHSVVGQDTLMAILEEEYTLDRENYVNSIFVRKKG